jgi:hypothetical protein
MVVLLRHRDRGLSLLRRHDTEHDDPQPERPSRLSDHDSDSHAIQFQLIVVTCQLVRVMSAAAPPSPVTMMAKAAVGFHAPSPPY